MASDDAGQATVFDRSGEHGLVDEASAGDRELAAKGGEARRRRIDELERRFGGPLWQGSCRLE